MPGTSTPSCTWGSCTIRAPPPPSITRGTSPGSRKLLEYVAQFHVPKLVVLSSANVYGPQPSNPQFLTEDAPLLGGQNFSDIRDLVEVDMLAQSFFWKLPETETVILRPVHILGACTTPPRTSCASTRFSPSWASTHGAGASTRPTWCMPSTRALLPGVRGHLQRGRPRAGAALAAHQDPGTPAGERALLPGAHRRCGASGRCG